jgi:hypothetical protein
VAGAALGSFVPVIGTAAGAVVGGILGALTGATVGGMVGAKAGEFVDEHVLDNYKCLSCAHTFGNLNREPAFLGLSTGARPGRSAPNECRSPICCDSVLQVCICGGWRAL